MGERFWGINKRGRNYSLWVMLEHNKRGRFLVFIEEKGEIVSCIFLLEGRGGDGGE